MWGGCLKVACAAFAAVAVCSWLVTAAAHIGDAYGVDHVAGVWLGLAEYAGDGSLYPPIYDGDSFGGTRYMPIPIELHGGLGAVIGDYLVAGKLIAYAMTVALLAIVFAVLRRESCPSPVAAALAATLLVTGTGVTASTFIRHDTLPVVLQLVAVALIVRSTSRNRVLAAGALSALALSAKLSAFWAPLAIAVWLLTRERSRLPAFLVAYLGSAAALLGTFEAITRGRLTDNILLGLTSARGFESFEWAENRIRLVFGEGLGPVRLLVVLALLVVGAAAWHKRLALYELSLLVSLPILAVVLADPGTSINQLVDLQVLSVVVLGAAWQRARPLLRTALTATVLAVSLVGYVQNVEPIEAVSVLVERETSRVPDIARRLDPSATLLSENPYVPISLGQRPVVLDAFMLWNIAHSRPEARDDLVRRLDAHEFDAVVLFYRPENRSTSEQVRFWYDTQHFGPEIVDAIARNYRSSESVDGRWIYTPKPSPS